MADNLKSMKKNKKFDLSETQDLTNLKFFNFF